MNFTLSNIFSNGASSVNRRKIATFATSSEVHGSNTHQSPSLDVSQALLEEQAEVGQCAPHALKNARADQMRFEYETDTATPGATTRPVLTKHAPCWVGSRMSPWMRGSNAW